MENDHEWEGEKDNVMLTLYILTPFTTTTTKFHSRGNRINQEHLSNLVMLWSRPKFKSWRYSTTGLLTYEMRICLESTPCIRGNVIMKI